MVHKAFAFDITTPIDVQSAIQGFNCDLDLFYAILGKLEEISLIPRMRELVDAFDDKNHRMVKKVACSLKESCGFVGVSRLYYISLSMQHEEELHKMME